MAAATSTRHRPKVPRRQHAEGWPGYRHECSCGESGPVRDSRSLAMWDRDQHIATLPKVPDAEKCQEPKAHRVAEWERCPLCADQLDLFEAAGGGS